MGWSSKLVVTKVPVRSDFSSVQELIVQEPKTGPLSRWSKTQNILQIGEVRIWRCTVDDPFFVFTWHESVKYIAATNFKWTTDYQVSEKIIVPWFLGTLKMDVSKKINLISSSGGERFLQFPWMTRPLIIWLLWDELILKMNLFGPVLAPTNHHTVGGSEIRRSPKGCIKSCKSGDKPLTSTGLCRISEPPTVIIFNQKNRTSKN